MRLSIAFARSTFIAIPNERQVKSLIDDLVTKRGVVSGRLALLRGSTETQPLETLTGHFPGNAHGSSRRKIFLTTPRVRVPRPRGRRLRQNLPFSRLRRAGLSASLRGCGGCRRAWGVWGLSASLGGGWQNGEKRSRVSFSLLGINQNLVC